MTKEIKQAIAEKHYEFYDKNKGYDWVDEAMTEYAANETASLQSENEKLTEQQKLLVDTAYIREDEIKELQSENESLRAALKELVAVLDMKLEMEHEELSTSDFLAMEAEYDIREPLAWEAARKLSK